MVSTANNRMEDFLGILEAATGQPPKQSGDGWLCVCPVPLHDDHRPSLSVGLGDDGRVLLHCHSGCTAEDIVKSLGLQLSDLFPEGQGKGAVAYADAIEQLAAVRGWNASALKRISAYADGDLVKFPMYDASGARCGEKFRRGDNRPMQTAAGQVKSLTKKGSRNGIMYPKPFPDSGQVLVVEGESDLAAGLSAGWPAVVATAGANPGKTGKAALQKLLHGRDCVLAPDPDDPGRKWMADVGGLLGNVRCRVNYIPATDKDLDARLRHETNKAAALSELIAGALPADEFCGDRMGFDENGKMIPLGVARAITKGRHLIAINGDFHEYQGGVYRRRPQWRYERAAVEIIGGKAKKSNLGDILKLLEIETAIENDEIYRSGRILNLRNGLLDLDGGLKPHTPDFISTVQIPVNFDENAECPTWRRCLSEWFPDENDVIGLLQEFFGICLVPDSSQHKVLILLGGGANGKSVACGVLKSLVGDENVSCVSLNSLSKSFALAELFGKLVNLTIEAEIKENIEEGVFKQIVSGDPIQAEKKFRDPFVFKPFCRFIISTNNLWRVNDRSDGFYRRLLIVKFFRGFSEEKQDRDLSTKLEAELSGILNWALAGLRRLESRGHFLIPQRVRNEIHEYRMQNNPTACWAEEMVDLDPKAWSASSVLYENYKRWADRNGHRQMSSKRFGMEIRRFKDVVPHQHPRTRARGYNGIILRIERDAG